MIHVPLKSGVSAAALVLVAGAAAADVNARQVWEAWQAGLDETEAVTLTTDAQEVEDARVTLTGARIVIDGANGDTTLRMDRLELVSQSNGSVTVALPDTIPVEIVGDDGGRATMELRQTGPALRVSGTPDALRHDLTADRLVLTADEIVDEEGTALEGEIRGSFDRLVASYTPTVGELAGKDYSLAADTFDLLVDVLDAQTNDPVVLSARLDNPTADGTLVWPTGVTDVDLPTALATGLSVRGGYGYDASAYIFDIGTDTDRSAGTVSSGPTRQRFEIAETGVSYEGATEGSQAEIRSSALPAPVTLELVSQEITLNMPAAPTDTPEPFALRYVLDGLSLGEEAWALVDPQGAIPRAPASLTVDLSGEGRVFDRQTRAGGGAPGVLSSLAVNEVALSVAGAALDVVGALAFDPETSAGAMAAPMPTGTLTVDATGLNGLIDAVIAAGILPPDQAMMPRLMLGMFARPVGDDALRSEVEFTEGGGITVNGQRVR